MRAILGLLALCLVLSSCKESLSGNGIVQRDKRAVADFDEIDISGQFNVFLRQAADPALLVEADENFLPYIKTEVQGDRLKIWGERSFRNFDKLDIYITAREIREIDLSGAMVVNGSQVIRAEHLEIDASGACELNLELQCEKIHFDGSGASEVVLVGFSNEANYDISGAGEINAIDLETRKTSIEMSGAGRADVFVTDELRIEVSGAGEVNYRGNPKEIKQEISGAAEINQL